MGRRFLRIQTGNSGETRFFRAVWGAILGLMRLNFLSVYQWQVPTSIAGPGATKTLTLDALQRPLSIEVKNNAAQVLASRAYQYDAAGDITQINSDLGKTEYGYDQLSRLTKATPDQSLQTLGLPAAQYSYDAVHNRTSSQHQAGSYPSF